MSTVAQILLSLCGRLPFHLWNVRTNKAGTAMKQLASAAVLWTLSVCACAAASGAGGASPPGYRVQPGDQLQVSVWKQDDLNLQVLVRPDGGFSFPLVGDVDARGKTVEQLQQELKRRLSHYISDPFVTVMVSAVNGNKIYVIGQVNKPGAFVVNPRVDVMQALSLAGGMTAFASGNNIFVLRHQDGHQRKLPFDFGEVSHGKHLEQNIMLQSGDVVVVP